MMMSSAIVSSGFSPNRDETFSSPRNLPLIVLSLISVGYSYHLLFLYHRNFQRQLRMSCSYKDPPSQDHLQRGTSSFQFSNLSNADFFARRSWRRTADLFVRNVRSLPPSLRHSRSALVSYGRKAFLRR